MITMFNLNQLKQKVLFGTFPRDLAKKEKSRARGAGGNSCECCVTTNKNCGRGKDETASPERDGKTKEILS